MLIRVYKDATEFDEFRLVVDGIQDILSGIKMIKGQEYTDSIINENYKYILISKNTEIEPVALTEDTLLSSFNEFDLIVILPEIIGADPATITAIYVGLGLVAEGTTLSTGVILATQLVIAIAVSMAVAGIMSLISPTTSFSSDPAQAQKQSSLFNGAPIITEQGGSVPLWYGESYAGGVLVSSGVSTSEG